MNTKNTENIEHKYYQQYFGNLPSEDALKALECIEEPIRLYIEQKCFSNPSMTLEQTAKALNIDKSKMRSLHYKSLQQLRFIIGNLGNQALSNSHENFYQWITKHDPTERAIITTSLFDDLQSRIEPLYLPQNRHLLEALYDYLNSSLWIEEERIKELFPGKSVEEIERFIQTLTLQTQIYLDILIKEGELSPLCVFKCLSLDVKNVAEDVKRVELLINKFNKGDYEDIVDKRFKKDFSEFSLTDIEHFKNNLPPQERLLFVLKYQIPYPVSMAKMKEVLKQSLQDIKLADNNIKRRRTFYLKNGYFPEIMEPENKELIADFIETPIFVVFPKEEQDHYISQIYPQYSRSQTLSPKTKIKTRAKVFINA